jgi:hypothetical protein
VKLWDNPKAPAYFDVTHDGSFHKTLDKHHEDNALWACITVTIAGTEYPCLHVDERQKDSWREHMPDWITIQSDANGWERFIRECVSSNTEKVIREQLRRIPILNTIISSCVSDRQIKAILDAVRQDLQGVIRHKHKEIPSIDLKSANSREVWLKNLGNAYIRTSGIADKIRESASILENNTAMWHVAYKGVVDAAFIAQSQVGESGKIKLHSAPPYWFGMQYHNLRYASACLEILGEGEGDARPTRCGIYVNNSSDTANTPVMRVFFPEKRGEITDDSIRAMLTYATVCSGTGARRSMPTPSS